MKKYIMACDERGTRSWPSSSNTWAFGGFIARKSKLPQLYKIWNEIKISLCGKTEVELKWSHFFDGRHQQKSINPLISINENDRRKDLIFALNKLCSFSSFTPVTVISRKNLIPMSEYDFYFEISKKGNLLLQDSYLKIGVYGLFSLYLEQVNGQGELWMDSLGSRKEQIKLNDKWKALRNSEQTKKMKPEHYYMTQRIDEEIKFFNSYDHQAIQLADFLSGVIWAAAEEDEEFLVKYYNKYAQSPILGRATLVKMP